MVEEAKCELVRWIMTRCKGASVEEAAETVEKCRNQYAHALAAQIRAMADEEVEAQGHPRADPADPKYDKAVGMYRAADLIDPMP